MMRILNRERQRLRKVLLSVCVLVTAGVSLSGQSPPKVCGLMSRAAATQQQPKWQEHAVEGISYQVTRTGAWNASTDRTLPIHFEGPEWSALFHDVLRVTDRESLVADEDYAEWEERQRVRFQKSIAEYPMLGKIWDTYIDVRYEPKEIPQLRDECLRVKASTSNPVALRGLDKLIAACDEASKDSLGLSLLSE